VIGFLVVVEFAFEEVGHVAAAAGGRRRRRGQAGVAAVAVEGQPVGAGDARAGAGVAHAARCAAFLARGQRVREPGFRRQRGREALPLAVPGNYEKYRHRKKQYRRHEDPDDDGHVRRIVIFG